MTQGFLYSSWMYVLRKHDRGEGMPQIVKTYFRQARFYQRLLKMPLNISVCKGSSIACCEHKPCSLFVLQGFQDKGGYGYRPSGLFAFRFPYDILIFYFLHGALDA